MITINDVPINVTMFPDKTSQIWKLPQELLKLETVEVVWKLEHEGEFLHLAQLKDLLDTYQVNNINLSMTYLPYGRQDKVINNKTTFALYTFSKLLNSLEFDNVFILDPHSNEALKLINNSTPSYPIVQVCNSINKTESTILCYPDKGAREKYTKEYSYLGLPNIYGEKVRDQSTGNITSYKLIGDPKDQTVLIIDDICDGGMTFKLLTKDLLEAGAKEVNLFVTHGIFSKGIPTLKDSGIKRIFTNDGEQY